MSNDYMAAQIQTLTGLGHVRLRPEMYLGATDIAALHHLIWEIVDNAVDEIMAGSGDRVIVTLNDDGSVSIQDFGRGICTGFLDGFAAGHFVAETWHGFHHRDEKIDDIFGHLCVPDGTTRGQLARVFVQFLEKNPERLKLPAGLLLEDALREAFPCPK